MHKSPPLSRRERQIMDVLYSRGRATAAEILEVIDDPPSNSALRTILRVLEDKGHVGHEEIGRVYVYSPTTPIDTARKSALAHVVDTFFDGSVESVVSTLMRLRGKSLDAEQAARIAQLIEDAARRGR